MPEKDETVELKLDLDGAQVTPNSWADAIRELERAPVAKAAAPAPRPAPARSAAPPAAPALTLASAMEQAIKDTHAAREALMAFTSAHPYLIAPNVHRMWEDNLKETALLLEREYARRDAAHGR